MKACIIYDSSTGNTKMLADKIATMFECAPIEDSDVVFIGSWTDKGSPTENIQKQLQDIFHKNIFYFGTCGFGGNQEYFDLLFERAKKYIDPTNTIMGHFYCQGKMPINIKRRYEKLLELNPEDSSIRSNISNFEEAMHHPDLQDLDNLKKSILNCIPLQI